MPPVVWWTREAEGGREVRNFLGALYHQTREADRKSELQLLWPLFLRKVAQEPDGRRVERLRMLPLFWASRESEPSGAGYDYVDFRLNVLGIVFTLHSDNYAGGRVRARFLLPLGEYVRGTAPTGERIKKFRFLPLVQYERRWRPGLESRSVGVGLEDSVLAREETEEEPHLDERVGFRFLHMLFGYDRDARADKMRLFLLGGALPNEGGEKTTLALWGQERGPSTDVEHQLFYRFLLFKRSGAAGMLPQGPRAGRGLCLWRGTQWLFHGSPRRLVRVGPLLRFASDWERDHCVFSLVSGLFAFERDGRSRRAKVLWLFSWRLRDARL
jgi:hypothetical protein